MGIEYYNFTLNINIYLTNLADNYPYLKAEKCVNVR